MKRLKDQYYDIFLKLGKEIISEKRIVFVKVSMLLFLYENWIDVSKTDQVEFQKKKFLI